MTNVNNPSNVSKLFKTAHDLAASQVEVANGPKTIAVKNSASLARIIDDPMFGEKDGMSAAIRNELQSSPDGTSFFSKYEALKAIPIGARSDADKIALNYHKKVETAMIAKITSALSIHQAVEYARSYNWNIVMSTTRNGEVFIRVQGPDDTTDRVKSSAWLEAGHKSGAFGYVFKCEDVVGAKRGTKDTNAVHVSKSTLPAIASALGSYIALEDGDVRKNANLMHTAFAIVDTMGVDDFIKAYEKHLAEMTSRAA